MQGGLASVSAAQDSSACQVTSVSSSMYMNMVCRPAQRTCQRSRRITVQCLCGLESVLLLLLPRVPVS